MLQSLDIQNYALIEQLHITFQDGFSVITGETGAGKSIIIGALGLILGERADTKYIKKGAKKCIIEATFQLSHCDYARFFEENDLDYDGDLCVVRREMSDTGKSRAFINDTPVSLTQLKTLGERLIDIHSQHQNLLLNNEGFLLGVIDAIAHNQKEKEAYEGAYQAYKSLRKTYRELVEKVERDRTDADFIAFQLQQLEEAALKSGEQEDLEQEVGRLNHVEDIKATLYRANALFEDEQLDLLHALRDNAERLSEFSDVYAEVGELGQRLESCYIELKDIADEVSDELDKVDFDPARLAFINERLSLIYGLLQKHHVTNVDELLGVQDDLASRHNNIENADTELADLKTRVETQYQTMLQQAAVLTEKRQKASRQVEQDIVAHLEQLGMPNVQFKVELTTREQPDISGCDHVTFLFNANKKAALQNITQIASGGEIARVMLSLKALLSSTQMLPTIIFDEIDTGVSGRIAEKMAQTMQQMGQHRQVISITHLPQIAAYGAHHYLVYKEDKNDETQTHIAQLTETQRVEEVAHMLSGTSVTEAALENAKELLKRQSQISQ